MSKGNKRSEILKKASELFLDNGFHLTGIDKIIRETPVAKMTFYNHFKSKNTLILQILVDLHNELLTQYTHCIEECEKQGKSVDEKLSAFFDLVAQMIKYNCYAGCLYQRAALEFVKEEGPIGDQILKHKFAILELCKRIVGEGSTQGYKPELLYTLYEGSLMQSLIHKDSNYIKAVPNYLK